MAIYILKSGLCLAILFGFYKIFLEKESFHNFKRFYLLSALILAFTIPVITFTKYIEVSPQNIPLNTEAPSFLLANELGQSHYLDYFWSISLWFYSIGLIIFGFKFFKNLSELIIKIKKHPKYRDRSFIYVLFHDVVTPHTFFNYIFLNKGKFESHQIPEAVLLHEETHAQQKHSLDILFVEILQVAFWFNPFLYLIKQSIKLNHEFLADQSVLQKGISTASYQNILFGFLSQRSESSLSNAINYSSIKKRFTVMKTTSSKQSLRIRGLIILPLLAVLIFSFSNSKVIERVPNTEQKELHSSTVYLPKQKKATKKQLKEYNDLAKTIESQINSKGIIKLEEVKRIKYLYSLMSPEQKKENHAFPNYSKLLPPPPPPSKSSDYKEVEKINKLEIQFQSQEQSVKTTKKSQNIVPPPPPPMLPKEPKNPSKKLINAKKDYEKRSEAYTQAMQIYLQTKKPNLLPSLNKMWRETMKKFKIYCDLANKELASESSEK